MKNIKQKKEIIETFNYFLDNDFRIKLDKTRNLLLVKKKNYLEEISIIDNYELFLINLREIKRNIQLFIIFEEIFN